MVSNSFVNSFLQNIEKYKKRQKGGNYPSTSLLARYRKTSPLASRSRSRCLPPTSSASRFRLPPSAGHSPSIGHRPAPRPQRPPSRAPLRALIPRAAPPIGRPMPRGRNFAARTIRRSHWAPQEADPPKAAAHQASDAFDLGGFGRCGKFAGGFSIAGTMPAEGGAEEISDAAGGARAKPAASACGG